MKRLLGWVAVAASFGCASVETATVSSNEVTTPGGDAVAVIQASALGFTIFFHLADIVNSDLDVSVNRLLVSEAKSMGASKIDLKDFHTTPRHGVYQAFDIQCFPILALFCWPSSHAVGIAVK